MSDVPLDNPGLNVDGHGAMPARRLPRAMRQWQFLTRVRNSPAVSRSASSSLPRSSGDSAPRMACAFEQIV
jgi:hypothetical protein